MDDNSKILDFVKAVSDADRLRIIGLLAQHAVSTKELSSQLGLPFREAFNHLGQLEFAGVVHKTDDLYSLNGEALKALSRSQFSGQHQTFIPAPELDAKARKVLAAYLNTDGSLKQIPVPGAQLRIVLHYLAAAFEPNVDYTEKEANAVLRRFHTDTASLRRELVDAGLLERESDGSRYWRKLDN